VHETSLPSPETVDLGARCVLPGFTDSHVHFPTWALSRRDVRLDGCASLAEALDRVRAAERSGIWLRGQGWRDAGWPDGPPTRQALDEIEAERPAMLISKDYHALWLNSAALALAGGDLEVEGGVVVRDEGGEPTGVLYERAAWQFKERYAQAPDDEYVAAMREGVRLAAARGVTAVHDKDGWLGAIGLWQRLEQEGGVPLRVWQSTPADRLADHPLGRPPQRRRVAALATRLPEGVHGRDAGLPDSVDVGWERRRDHDERGARGDRPRGRRGGLAGRRARDRRRGEPRGPRRVRALARRLAAAAACARGSSTPSASRRRTSRASRSSASPRPSSSRTRRPTSSSPSATGRAGSTARTRSARCSTPAPSSRTAPTHPWRSSSRGPA